MLKFVWFPSHLSLITVAVHIFVYICVYLHHYTRAGRYVAYMPYSKICSTCDVVNGCTADMKYSCHINILSHQPVIGSGVLLLSLSSNALSQHTADPHPPIQKTLLAHACFVSVAEGREARERPETVRSVAAAHSVFTYQYLLSFPHYCTASFLIFTLLLLFSAISAASDQ